MNNIVTKFLMAGDKFMPEMHLRQPGITYSACGPFTKHKQRIQKFMQIGDTNYIYKNDLDKSCCAHDVANSHRKDFAKRTAADKVLKSFKIASNPDYNGYEWALASMVHRFFQKIASDGGLVQNEIKENQQLAN